MALPSPASAWVAACGSSCAAGVAAAAAVLLLTAALLSYWLLCWRPTAAAAAAKKQRDGEQPTHLLRNNFSPQHRHTQSSSILLAPVVPHSHSPLAAAVSASGVSTRSPLQLSQRLTSLRQSLSPQTSTTTTPLGNPGSGWGSPTARLDWGVGSLASTGQAEPASATSSSPLSLSMSGGASAGSGGRTAPNPEARAQAALLADLNTTPAEVDLAAKRVRAYVSHFIAEAFLPALERNARDLVACNPALTLPFARGAAGGRAFVPTALQPAPAGRGGGGGGALFSLDALLEQQAGLAVPDSRYLVVRAEDMDQEPSLLLTLGCPASSRRQWRGGGGAGGGGALAPAPLEVDLIAERAQLASFVCPEPFATAARVQALCGGGAREEAGDRPDVRAYCEGRLAAFARDAYLLDFLGDASRRPEGEEESEGADAARTSVRLPTDSEILMNFVLRMLDAGVAARSGGACAFTDRPFHEACVAAAPPTAAGGRRGLRGGGGGEQGAFSPSTLVEAARRAANSSGAAKAVATTQLQIVSSFPVYSLLLRRLGGTVDPGSAAGGRISIPRAIALQLMSLLKDDRGMVGGTDAAPLLRQVLGEGEAGGREAAEGRAFGKPGTGRVWQALGLRAF